MKTKTQLLILTLLIVISACVNFSYAIMDTWRVYYTLPIEGLYDVPSCANTSKLYLNQDNDNDTLQDYYVYLNSNFVYPYAPTHNYNAIQILRTAPSGNQYSRVKYYRPMSNMLYKVNKDTLVISNFDDNTFWRPSRVLPYNIPVRGIATTPNRIVFERPSDNNASKNTIWFVYHYEYVKAGGFSSNGGTSQYFYVQVPSMSYLDNAGLTLTYLQPDDTRSWIADLKIGEVCQNFELHRCGDGTTDTYSSSRGNIFSGEVCDDGALNGTQDHCNNTCSGMWGFYCGDEIINDGSSETVTLSWVNGLYYGPTYYSWTELVFETCDNGDDPNDPDGEFNQDGTWQFCSANCFDNFTEAFVEVFINE